MADNVVLNTGSGGDTVAADDVAGVKYQVVKLAVGADGAASLVADASPLPISDAGGSLTVDGTVGVTGVSTAANQTTIIGHLDGVETLLGTIDADTSSLAGAVAGTEMQVDVVAALPAGANNIGDVDVLTVPADPFGANADAASATGSISAKLRFIASTGIPVTGTVTVASHAVTNAGTFAVQNTAATPAGTNNIGDVDIASIAAGDNNIGNVDIASALPAGTNNIGDVDVLSIIPGTGATSLGKAEDAAHSSGDVGVMMLAVRQNSQVDLGADGDYVPPTVDDSGGLRVSIVAGAGSGGTASADDADFTAGTTQGTIAQGVYESTPTSVTDGDVGAIGITANREVKVSVTSGGVAGIVEDSASAGGEEGVMILAVRRDSASSGVSADGDFAALSVTSDGSLRVSGSAGTTQYTEDGASAGGESLCLMGAVRRDTAASSSGTDGDYSTVNVNSAGRLYATATIDAALPAGTNNIGDVDVLTVPADPFGANADAASATGSISAKLRFIANTGIPVTGTVTVGSHAVTNAGTFATQVDGAALTALQLIDNACLADDAAFTPASSGVHVAGFFADETATDSVDEGDTGAARMSLDRKQYVIAHNETSTIYQNGTARTPVFGVIDAATSGDNTLLAAQGAGNKIRVHQLFLVSAGTVNVRFESGAGGTALSGQMNLVANTGFVLPYSPIGWFETAANTLLNLELSAAVSVDGAFAYTVVT